MINNYCQDWQLKYYCQITVEIGTVKTTEPYDQHVFRSISTARVSNTIPRDSNPGPLLSCVHYKFKYFLNIYLYSFYLCACAVNKSDASTGNTLYKKVLNNSQHLRKAPDESVSSRQSVQLLARTEHILSARLKRRSVSSGVL